MFYLVQTISLIKNLSRGFNLLFFQTYLLNIWKLGVSFALEIKAAAEEIPHALHISVEVKLGVQMGRAHHLREINKSHLVAIAEYEIELVEIAMYETVVAQVHNQIHDVVVDLLNISDLVYLT